MPSTAIHGKWVQVWAVGVLIQSWERTYGGVEATACTSENSPKGHRTTAPRGQRCRRDHDPQSCDVVVTDLGMICPISTTFTTETDAFGVSPNFNRR